MKKRIEINEGHISQQATKDHALQLLEALQDRGWPVTYVDDREEPVWQFATQREHQQFLSDLERTVDELWGRQLSWSVSWECSCEERNLFCQCNPDRDPTGSAASPLDPARREIQQQVNLNFPELKSYLELAVDLLYGAVLFGHQHEQKTGEPSFTSLWLGRHLHDDSNCRTYDRELSQAGALFIAAAGDARLDEKLSSHRRASDSLLGA